MKMSVKYGPESNNHSKQPISHSCYIQIDNETTIVYVRNSTRERIYVRTYCLRRTMIAERQRVRCVSELIAVP